MTEAEVTETQPPPTETEPLAVEPQPVVIKPTAADPTPADYGVGSVKRDPATLAVAVRTNILDPERRKDWGVMSIDRGGMYATYEQVSTWTDLLVVTP